jgi:CelD/BcsL family acetyltransferase involved in cellulose biosynthesis
MVHALPGWVRVMAHAAISPAQPAVSPPHLSVERIADPSQFATLREEWQELLAVSPADCLFLTWEWLYTWWNHLSGGACLHLLTARSGGKLIAIAPFLFRRSRAVEAPFPVLEFLGGIVGSDYLDLILRPGAEPEALRVLADYLDNAKIALRLTQLRAGASAVALAAELERRGWWREAAETDLCPLVTWATPAWDSYLATLSSKDRVDFRRRLNNLHKQFDVRFELVETEAERRGALGVLFELHDSRWRERGGSTALYTPALRSFHDELTRLALQQGWLRLFILTLDGRPAAAQYSFRYRQTFYDYQKGFDPGYSRHGVGLLTTGLTIRTAIEEGAAEFDFLHGAEPYKFRWTRHAHNLLRLDLFPPGMHGRIQRRLVATGAVVRKTARRLLGDALAERITRSRG